VRRKRKNPDRKTRALERAAAQGDVDAGAALLAERLRSGDLILPQVILAAGLGDPASQAVVAVERPALASHIRRTAHNWLPGLEQGFLKAATTTKDGRGQLSALMFGASLRATIAILDALREVGLVPAPLEALPAEAREWLAAPHGEGPGQHERIGEAINDNYLLFLEGLDGRTIRGKTGASSDLWVPADPPAEVAMHLVRAIGMSSGDARTRWKWGWPSDRLQDAMRAAYNACIPEGASMIYMDACLDRITAAVQAEVIPWLLEGKRKKKNPGDRSLRKVERLAIANRDRESRARYAAARLRTTGEPFWCAETWAEGAYPPDGSRVRTWTIAGLEGKTAGVYEVEGECEDRVRVMNRLYKQGVGFPLWGSNPKAPKKLMLDRILKGEKVALWHSARPALLKQLRTKAKSATQVQANEAWRWVAVEANKSSWRIPEDFPVVAPPFPYLYVEFDNVEEFAHQDKSAWSSAGVFLSWDGDSEGGWQLTGDVFLLFETMGLFHAGSVTVNVSPTGQIIPGPGSPRVALGMVPVMWISALGGTLGVEAAPAPEPRRRKKGSQRSFIPHPRTFATSRTELLDTPDSPEALTADYERMVLDVFGGALMAVVFMHSKGVKLHDSKGRPARRKKGKAKRKGASKPGLVHKVLDVGLEANASLREAKASGGDARAAVRLHWRRGRFNLYGVQGRKPHVSGFVGPMWIRPHMAGKLPGEVKKQYRIKKRKNPGDAELQRLRRAAAAGDPDAQEAFERHRERTFPAPEWIEMAKGDTFVTLRPLDGGVIVYGGPGKSYKIPEGTLVSDPYTARLGDIRFDWVAPDGKEMNTTVEGSKSRWPYDVGVFHTWSLRRVGPDGARRARQLLAEAKKAENLRRKARREEWERKKRRNPPRMTPDRILRRAERLLIANPAMIDQFLRNIGERPTEAQKLAWENGGHWGEHPEFSSEDWQHAVGSGYDRQGYWEWAVAQSRYAENPPGPDETLRRASRILAADPARMTGFLDGLLYSGQLPIPLIHKIHGELMRYDLMEKLPLWVVEVVQNNVAHMRGMFGTRMRALADAGARAANQAGRTANTQWIADQINEMHEAAYALIEEDPSAAEELFRQALALWNDERPAWCVKWRVRQGHVE
jgi:hypothetical protein